MTTPVSTGPWNSATAYAVDDVVNYAGADWVAIADSVNVAPLVGATGHWTELQPNTTWVSPGSWSYPAAYTAGDQVYYGGAIWTAVTPVQGTVPSSPAWSGDGPPLWDSGTDYVANDLVVDSSGSVWVALVHSTGVAPGSDNTFWASVVHHTLPIRTHGGLETIAKTATRWAELNPVLEIGSEGIESDTGLTKVGDGVSRWTDLPYPGTRVKGIQTFSTLDRPSASAEGVGAAYYDTTLGLPGFSNGTVWKDAAGNVI